MNDPKLWAEILYWILIHGYRWNGCWIPIIHDYIGSIIITGLLVSYLTDLTFGNFLVQPLCHQKFRW